MKPVISLPWAPTPLQRLTWVGAVVLVLVVELLVAAMVKPDELRWGGTIPGQVLLVVTILADLTLLLRNRYPIQIFAVFVALGLVGLLVPTFMPFLGLLVALNGLAARLPARISCAALLVSAVPLAVGAYNGAADGQPPDAPPAAMFVAQVAIYLAMALAAWGLGRFTYLTAKRAEAVREVRAAEAIQSERLRLARDLHDTVSHAVTAMLLQAAGAQTLLRPDDQKVRVALQQIEQTGIQAMDELRRLLGLLRDDAAEDEDQTGEPTLDELDGLMKLTRSLGVRVDVSVDGRPATLDPTVDRTAYHVVQEALTNTLKHAGQGASATVAIHWGVDALRLEIDNTYGIRKHKVPSTGNGLRGLRERAALIGGTLTTKASTTGYHTEAILPFTPLSAIDAAGGLEFGVQT